MRSRTQVGIVGAGPAGLLLSHLLQREGIESIVIEDRSRDHVESRIRAGVLEQGSVDVLNQAGVGERMRRESLVHEGIELRFQGAGHRIDFPSLTGGKRITVYGQHEVVKDLIAARLAAGAGLVFDVAGVSIAGFAGDSPVVRYERDGVEHNIDCDFIAGCDGFHGICRHAVPPDRLTVFERVYPYGWLGILAESTPASYELIYAHHDRGFALLSMRSATLSRLYVQCDPMTILPIGRTIAFGMSCSAAPNCATAASGYRKDRSCRKGSHRCGASSSSPCSTAGSFSPAMPPISCRRRERRA
jgi:p-hydroxybenzoate 3-monooxygenase